MKWKFWKKKKPVVLSAEVPDGINLELNTEKVVEPLFMPRTYTPPPYVEPTDKEMIEGLEESERYEEAFRLRDLKKENANLKRKLTILQKKYDACKEKINDWHD